MRSKGSLRFAGDSDWSPSGAHRLEIAVSADAQCEEMCEFAEGINVALVKMRILRLRSESESGVGRRARKYGRNLREKTKINANFNMNGKCKNKLKIARKF